jgi:hypothetical protein
VLIWLTIRSISFYEKRLRPKPIVLKLLILFKYLRAPRARGHSVVKTENNMAQDIPGHNTHKIQSCNLQDNCD